MPENNSRNMEKRFCIHGQVQFVANKRICEYKLHGGCTVFKGFKN